jgi:hypothetical protein
LAFGVRRWSAPLFALIRVHSRLVLSTLPEEFLEFAELGQGLAGVDYLSSGL